METVRVRREEQFSDRQFYREDPLKTDKIAFSIYDFEPWQALSMRRHPRSDTIALAVQGEGTMFMDNETFSVETGEAVYVPAGTCYGILAGENDMVVTMSQGPTPIATEFARGLEYSCPACGLESPVTTNMPDDAVLDCPRCEARLKLTRDEDTFKAQEIGPPEFTGGAGTGAGTEMPRQASDAAGEAGREASGEPSEPARIAFSVYEFGPWQVLPMHRNPGSDTVLYVATGQGIVFLNDEERSVDAEMAVYVPANATYGMLAADQDMNLVAIQCPVPVDAEVFEDLGYNCPVCDLGTPVTTNAYSGCVTVCPRCNVKLKLTREPDGFRAEETREPAPTEAQTL